MTKRMGRPPKPAEEKFITRSIRFPPDLWKEFSALVPKGSCSAVIQRLMAREVKRRQRIAAKQSEGTAE